MSENAIVVFNGGQIKLTKEQYDTFVSSISSQNPTEDEIKLHLWYCDSKNVNPLDKLIYFTKRQGRYTPITSIDFMRLRAESSGAYAGSDDAVFEVKEGVKYPISAKVTVYKMVQGRLGRFEGTARWSEYAPQDINDKSAFMWRKMPFTMLAKCAEALTLRKAFPGQLHGLYASEEMAQDGRYVNVESGEIEQAYVDAEVKAESRSLPAEHSETTKQAEQEAHKLSDGYTGKQILAKPELVNQIKELSGKSVKDVCAAVGKLESGKKFTIQQVVAMLVPAETVTETTENKENEDVAQ